MTPNLSTTEVTSAAEPSASREHERAERASARRWLTPALSVLVLILIGVLGWYTHEPVLALFKPPPAKGAPAPDEPVSVSEPGVVAIASGSPVEHRLQVVPVRREDIAYPLLSATGYVMARLAPGADHAESRWDFALPEVATAYADWLNTRADVIVLEKQATKTRELVKVQVEYLKKAFDRKEAAFLKGAVPEGDMLNAKADYLKADIQGQKDITDAETAFKKAERNRGLLERQLFQAGVDPEVVRKATEGLVLVVADVPEAKIELVKVGQPCEARFFGVPDKVFKGRVGRLGPSVVKEKRTLRVTFELVYKSERLLPGMFADIGLGTESRSVLTVPTEAVLHAGSSDYVLKEIYPGKYRATEVKVDEPRQIVTNGAGVSCIPVRSGPLSDTDRVVGPGAILLKPIMAKALTNGAH